MPVETHNRLGGSNCKRWRNCPASVTAEAEFPDESSPYAREGTAAHALLEQALRDSLSPETWIGTHREVDGEEIEVTQEMVDAVTVCYDFVEDLCGEFGLEGLDLEKKVEVGPLFPHEPMGGTVDIPLLYRVVTEDGEDVLVLHLIDYKHGRGVVVEAKDNDQLRLYALSYIAQERIKPDLIVMTIVQPRAPHPDGPIRTDTATRAELKAWSAETLAAAEEAVTSDNPTYRIGDWCQFCKAHAVCPAQKQAVTDLALVEFEDLTVAPEPFPRPETLTVEELGRALDAFGPIQAWMKAAREYAASLLDKGEEVPGYKLVDKRANRQWKDEEAALTYLTEELEIPEEDLYTKKMVSPAQAEKVIKALFAAGLRPKVDDHVHKSSSGTTMVPASDPRPAALLAGVDDFEVLNLDEEEK